MMQNRRFLPHLLYINKIDHLIVAKTGCKISREKTQPFRPPPPTHIYFIAIPAHQGAGREWSLLAGGERFLRCGFYLKPVSGAVSAGVVGNASNQKVADFLGNFDAAKHQTRKLQTFWITLMRQKQRESAPPVLRPVRELNAGDRFCLVGLFASTQMGTDRIDTSVEAQECGNCKMPCRNAGQPRSILLSVSGCPVFRPLA